MGTFFIVVHSKSIAIQRFIVTAVTLILSISACTTNVAAQTNAGCGVILQDTVLPSDGFGHRVMFYWDFDGDGPLPEELLVGTEGARVLAYDGTRWRQVGGRMGGAQWPNPTDPIVLDLVGFRGELYAIVSGSLSNSAGAVFRYNGTDWITLPQTPAASLCSGAVTGWFIAATVYNNKLTVVGSGLRCGTQLTLALQWDGSRWSSMGTMAASGLDDNSIAGAVYVTHDNRLFVGGTINTTSGSRLVVEYTGGLWVPRMSGFGNVSGLIPVARFQEVNNELYVVTAAAISSPNNFPTALHKFNTFDNSFSLIYPPVPTGMLLNAATRLVTIGDTWYLAGSMGVDEAVVITRTLDGPWTKLNITGARMARMRDLAEYDGKLIGIASNTSSSVCNFAASAVAGNVGDTSLTLEPSRFAMNIGAVPSIARLAITNAGTFVFSGPESSNAQILSAGNGSVNNCVRNTGTLARRGTTDWEVATNVTPMQSFNGQVRDIVDFRGEVYAFGAFTSVGGTSITAGVAQWTGTNWTSGLAPLSTNVVSAIVHLGDLYITENSGNTTITKRWELSAWGGVGTPMNVAGARLISVQDDLFAYVYGGSAVYKFDSGVWVRLTDPFAGGVTLSDATAHNNELIVASGNTGTQNIKRWDTQSQTWQVLPVFPTTVGIRSLASHAGMLYAGLSYTSSTVTAPLMRLRDSTWEMAVSIARPHAGIAHPQAWINDMVSIGNELRLVGNISYLDRQTAEGYAVYYTGLPTVTSQPIDTQVSGCQEAVLSVAVRESHDPNITYQWSRNGQPLDNSPDFQGVTRSTLRISPFAPLGEFHVSVSNSCGATHSQTVNVSRTCSCNPCPPDYNFDGGIDGADVEAYFNDWVVAECLADINLDGGVDGVDIQFFFEIWANGSC